MFTQLVRPGQAIGLWILMTVVLFPHSAQAALTPPFLIATVPAGSLTSIQLNWTDPNTTESGYAVERCNGVCTELSTFTRIKSLGRNTIKYTNTGLAVNTTYSYRIKAKANGVTPVYSNIVSITTGSSADTISPIISSISASGTSPYTTSQTVTITAVASDNVGVTRVEFYDGATLKGTYTSAPYTYAWSITSADNGTHSFTARAYDAAGNPPGVSTAISLMVNLDITPPSVPTGLTATDVAQTTATIYWTASSDDSGIASYSLYRNNIFMASLITTTVVDPLLSADTLYTYTVSAVDNAGNASAQSAPLVIHTLAAPTITTQPVNQPVTAPATAIFSVTAAGNPTPSYQWQKSTDGVTFNNISGATSASYTTPSTTTADNGAKFRCVASNSQGTATSNAATLTVSLANTGYILTLSSSGPGTLSAAPTNPPGVSCGTNCMGYSSGINVTLNASPSGGYATTWSGCDVVSSDNANKCDVTMGSNKSVNVMFTLDTAPPTVKSIDVHPSTEGTIAGTNHLITANVSDNGVLNRVDIYMDNSVQWILCGTKDLSTPVSSAISTTVNVDTTNFQNGSHSLMSIAYDQAGNPSSPAIETVNVANVLLDPGTTQMFKVIAKLVDSHESGGSAGSAVKADGNKNIIVVGNFTGNTNFGATNKSALGGTDVFIEKFNSNGDLQWFKTFGGNSDDKVYSVAIDSSGSILITGMFFGTANFGGTSFTSAGGTTTPDIFVAKYDSNGDHLWSYQLGKGGIVGWNSGTGIAVDSSDNVIVIGNISGQADLGGGVMPETRVKSADGFVLKMTSNGDYIWAISFGSNEFDFTNGVAVDSEGNVIVTGNSSGSMDFGFGSPLPVPSKGYSDMYLVKYAGVDGHYLWSHLAGGPYPDTAGGIAVDVNKNIYVTGVYGIGMDFGFGKPPLIPHFASGMYFAKYDTTGTLLWVKGISNETDPGGVGSAGIVVDSSTLNSPGGNILITGYASGTVNFGNVPTYGAVNIFVAKYSPAGNFIWVKRHASPVGGQGKGSSIAVDSERNVLSTGYIQGEVNFDGFSDIGPNQQSRAYLVKISP